MFFGKTLAQKRSEALQNSVMNPSSEKMRVNHENNSIMEVLEQNDVRYDDLYREFQRKLIRALEHARKYRTKTLFVDVDNVNRCVFWHKGTFNMVPGLNIVVNISRKSEKYNFGVEPGYGNADSRLEIHQGYMEFMLLDNFHDNDIAFRVPICNSAEEYFEYQLMYPYLVLTHEQILELLGILAYSLDYTRKINRFTRVRAFWHFAKLLALVPFVYCKVLKIKFFED